MYNNEDRSNANGSSLLDILSQHMRLLTTEFYKYNNPDVPRSEWVGYSAIFNLLPILFIKGGSIMVNIFKACWFIQAPLSYASDYQWASTMHISHGLDRWLATSLLVITIIMGFLYLNLWEAILGTTIVCSFIYSAKGATVEDDECKYNINQTLWHIIGPLVACLIFYRAGI